MLKRIIIVAVTGGSQKAVVVYYRKAFWCAGAEGMSSAHLHV
jgi:hypothetical protein